MTTNTRSAEASGNDASPRSDLYSRITGKIIVADLGLTPEVRDDHAAYIASWLTVLQNETRSLHLHRRQPRAARGRLSARLAGRGCAAGGATLPRKLRVFHAL